MDFFKNTVVKNLKIIDLKIKGLPVKTKQENDVIVQVNSMRDFLAD